MGGNGSAGMPITQAGSSGMLAAAGNGVAGDGVAGMMMMPSGGEAGDLDAGSGGTAGMEEPPVVGTFANCPPRMKWMILSNPTVAQLQAVGTSMNIAASQLQPEYAIDEGDVSGTATRFSTGRPSMGDEFLSVDMGAERWVSGVYTKEPSLGDYGRRLEVTVSRDGNLFTKVADQLGTSGAYDILFKPVIARFVRINQTGSTMQSGEWWSVHDYKVYCTSDAVPSGGSGGTGGGAGAPAGGGGTGGGAGTAGGGTGTAGGAGGSGGKGGTGGT